MNLQTLHNSFFVGLFVIFITYCLTVLFQYIGLQDVNPGIFFSEICHMSLLQAWVVYGFISFLMSLGYIRFCRISIKKSVLGNGIIWGFVFFMASQFLIAVVRVLFGAPKDPNIAAKTFSLIVLNLFIGIVIAYTEKLLRKYCLSKFKKLISDFIFLLFCK